MHLSTYTRSLTHQHGMSYTAMSDLEQRPVLPYHHDTVGCTMLRTYVPKCLAGTSPPWSKYQFQGHNIQSQLWKRVRKIYLFPATELLNQKCPYITLENYICNSQEKTNIRGSFLSGQGMKLTAHSHLVLWRSAAKTNSAPNAFTQCTWATSPLPCT
jgi:hypothetical protein